MRRALLLAGAAVLLLSGNSYAQLTATIAGGPHDLSSGSGVRNSNTTINGQTCVFCHVPHSGSTNQPLWNRSNPTGASYQPYTSSTSKTVATGAAIASGISGACLSCHDGTIAMDVVTNVNGIATATWLPRLAQVQVDLGLDSLMLTELGTALDPGGAADAIGPPGAGRRATGAGAGA